MEEAGIEAEDNRTARFVAYGAAPVALVILVLLRRAGLVADVPIPVYVAALASTTVVSMLVDRWKECGPGTVGMHIRIVGHVACVTTVIYMCGWGPVLGMAYVFNALAELEQSGSATWRAALGWSIAGAAVGQAMIWAGLAPSFLPLKGAETAGLLGVVVFALALRMAGAIGEHKERAEAALAYQAHHDSLTGLANRSVLVSHLARVIEAERDATARPYLLFLDLDRFKAVNDTFGHAAGDRLLCDVADRLRDVMRASDALARFGGDEFVVLIDATDDAGARAVAQRILDQFARPFTIGDESVQVGTSIGIARVDDHVVDAETLLSDADAAMYFAKAHRSDGAIRFFDDTTRQAARARMRVDSDLAHALDRDELRVAFSPIVTVANGRMAGVQATVRWEHPTRGLLGPEDFLESAERSGLSLPIGAWLLTTACTTVAQWNLQRPADDPLHLAISCTARQLEDPELVPRLQATLAATGLPSRLVHLAFDASGTTRARLDALHAAGITLGLESFGTPASTLESLRDLPVCAVKIAPTFVATIDRDDRARNLVAGIIDLAHRLDLLVVADGVDRPEQSAVLADLGCDFAHSTHAEPASLRAVYATEATHVREETFRRPA